MNRGGAAKSVIWSDVSGVVRGVGADIHRLVTVTTTAMKSGYSSLLADFLPEFEAMVPGDHPESDEEE